MTVEQLLDIKKDILLAIEKENKKFNIISYIRLVLFLGLVISAYVGISGKNMTALLIAGLLVVSFVVCIILHSKIDERKSALESKDEVVTRFISRITGKWIDFEDTGSEFIKQEDTVVKDLDLLGPGSLYQMISMAHTLEGRRALADKLSDRNVKPESISARNTAITELSKKIEFLIKLETSLIRMGKHKAKDTLVELVSMTDGTEDLEEKSKGNAYSAWRSSFLVSAVLIILINAAALIIGALGLFGLSLWILIPTIIVGNIITSTFSTKIERLTSNIYSYSVRAEEYESVLGIISEEGFDADILKAMSDDINSSEGILSGMKSLKVIGGMQNLAYNPVLHFLFDGLFGFGLITAYLASGWNMKYRDLLKKAVNIIATFEELSSLSVLSVVRKTVSPVFFEEDRPKIEAVEIYHPLIDPDKVISNSASVQDKVTIITGSNMSGKTTFLRTVALNMALAYMGANVCAESFSLSYMKIFTSMRVSDDALNGISTFFAEILRIKEMAEYTRNAKAEKDFPAACFIDEIFKGTNSADRIVGAENALKKLSEGNALVMVSTHDFELCDLKDAEDKPVTNHHFEEYYENDEIKFDYKIKDGRCTTRNAMSLLKMAGLS